jgi:site-specific recombinase XerD
VAAATRPLASSARAVAIIAPVSAKTRPEALLGVFLASRGTLKSRRTTLQGLERCARTIGAPVETVRWHELRVEHTTAIRGSLITARYGKATITSSLTALRGVLRYAYRLGFMTADDYQRAVQLDAIPGEAPLAGRALSREEIGKLRAFCASETGAYGRFLEATFALLLSVGLRATEACTMPIAGWLPKDRAVRVRRKRNKEAILPVDRRAAACLDTWCALRMERRVPTQAFLVRVQRNDWVRPATAQMNDRTLEYVLACAAKAAGVAHFTPHDLRRTFITLMLDAGKDTLTVAALASHGDPKTTALYDRRGDAARAREREDVEIW